MTIPLHYESIHSSSTVFNKSMENSLRFGNTWTVFDPHTISAQSLRLLIQLGLSRDIEEQPLGKYIKQNFVLVTPDQLTILPASLYICAYRP